MSHFIGGIVAFALLIAAVGFTAQSFANMSRTPAEIRRGAAATSKAIRHPVRTARTAGPKAAQGAEAAWAKVRAEDWLERRRASRARRDERRANRTRRPPGERRRWRPRVVITGPASITGRPPAPTAPGGTQATPPATAPAPPAGTTPAPDPATTPTPGTPTERPTAMPTIGRGMTGDHATVNNRVANTEPENDGELVQFFMAEAAGLLGYAQAWEQLIEHLLAKVGLDPASMQGAHDIHQAAAECAQLTTKAVQRFKETYSGVIENASRGVVMPHHGRFMTGDSA